MSKHDFNSPNSSRRKFLARSFTASAAMMAGSSLIASTATAAEPTVLSEDDPIAMALGYKADANQVDTAKYPKRAGTQGAKQLCSNCTLYTATTDGMGLCSAIPGKLVTGAGWCQAWVGNV